MQQKPFAVSALKLVGEEYASLLSATGTALPLRESTLSSQVEGTVEAIMVKRGDRVKKGQALLRLERQSFALGVEQAKAALKAAEIAFNQMKMELKRQATLLKSNTIPPSTFERVKAQHDAAAAQVSMTTVGLKRAEKALSDATIRAPYRGTITAIHIQVGEFIPRMPPPRLMTIVDASSLEAQIFLPENEASSIKVGQQARVAIESSAVDRVGEIIFVSDRVQERTQTFEVRVRFNNRDHRVKAGAFARVSFSRRSYSNAIFVPLDAIRHGRDEQPFVFRAERGRARLEEVQLGGSRKNHVHVTCCLRPGQTVITSGLVDLTDGAPVVISLQ